MGRSGEQTLQALYARMIPETERSKLAQGNLEAYESWLRQQAESLKKTSPRKAKRYGRTGPAGQVLPRQRNRGRNHRDAGSGCAAFPWRKGSTPRNWRCRVSLHAVPTHLRGPRLPGLPHITGHALVPAHKASSGLPWLNHYRPLRIISFHDSRIIEH